MAQYTGPIFVVWQCKLLSDWGPKKTEISAVLLVAHVARKSLYLVAAQ